VFHKIEHSFEASFLPEELDKLCEVVAVRVLVPGRTNRQFADHICSHSLYSPAAPTDLNLIIYIFLKGALLCQG
jgi:hypothetical protein